MNNIHKDIDRIGKWSFSHHGIESVTTNRSESMNALVAGFFNWKQHPVDCFVVGLRDLFHSFHVQIMRARYKVGEKWTLVDPLANSYDLLKDKPQLTASECTEDEYKIGEEIVRHIKNAKVTVQSMVNILSL